jgi:hypothetical protein
MKKTARQLDKFLRKKPKLGRGVYLAKTAVVLGDVTLGAHSSVWYGAVLRGDIAYHACDKRLTYSDRQTDVTSATGLDFQRAATPRCCYYSRHGTCVVFKTKRRSRNRSTTTQCARIIMKSPFSIRLWILIAALFLVAGGTIYALSFA